MIEQPPPSLGPRSALGTVAGWLRHISIDQWRAVFLRKWSGRPALEKVEDKLARAA